MSERTVPFYACEHGTPGGCGFCNAVEKPSAVSETSHTDHPLRHFDRTCPGCKGSGETTGMTYGRGPDDHEVPVDCPECNGTGALSAPSAVARTGITEQNIEYARKVLKQINEGLRDYEIDRLCDAALASLPSSGAVAIETERDALRRGQGEAVMPLIGNLLDQWDSVPNDMKDAIREIQEGFEQAIDDISDAMENVKPSAAPAGERTLVDACRGLVSYWTRNLRNFQWEKADEHVKRINIALGSCGCAVEKGRYVCEHRPNCSRDTNIAPSSAESASAPAAQVALADEVGRMVARLIADHAGKPDPIFADVAELLARVSTSLRSASAPAARRMSDERIDEIAASVRNPRRAEVKEMLRKVADEASALSASAPAARLIRALDGLLRHCDMNPEGETDFEKAVIEGRLALAEAMTGTVSATERMILVSELLAQARRVRNYSDPSKVFDAVPLRALGVEKTENIAAADSLPRHD